MCLLLDCLHVHVHLTSSAAAILNFSLNPDFNIDNFNFRFRERRGIFLFGHSLDCISAEVLKCSEASKGEHSTETKNIYTEIGRHPRRSHLVRSCRASNTGNTSWNSCSVRTSSTICSACWIRFSLLTFNLNFNFFEERSSREQMEIFILVHPIFSKMEHPFASHHCWVCLCNRFS